MRALVLGPGQPHVHVHVQHSTRHLATSRLLPGSLINSRGKWAPGGEDAWTRGRERRKRTSAHVTDGSALPGHTRHFTYDTMLPVPGCCCGCHCQGEREENESDRGRPRERATATGKKERRRQAGRDVQPVPQAIRFINHCSRTGVHARTPLYPVVVW